MVLRRTDGQTDLHGDVLEGRNGRHVVLRRTDRQTDSYLRGDVLEGRNGRHIVPQEFLYDFYTRLADFLLRQCLHVLSLTTR